MKNRVIPAIVLLCILSLRLSAQLKAPLNQFASEKPLLFSDLPQKFNISKPAVEKIFAGSSLGNIKIPIDNNRVIEGVITERLQRSATLTTVNIKLPQYHQALFTLSRISGANISTSYVGRVVHIEFGDMLLLKQERDQIYLVKEKQSLVLVE